MIWVSRSAARLISEGLEKVTIDNQDIWPGVRHTDLQIGKSPLRLTSTERGVNLPNRFVPGTDDHWHF